MKFFVFAICASMFAVCLLSRASTLAAQICTDILEDQAFTPSKWFMEATNFASHVVASRDEYNNPSSNSVWNLTGINYPASSKQGSERALIVAKRFGLDSAHYIFRQLEILVNRKALLLPTSRSLGIRAMNQMISHHIYPLGFNSDPVKVDGRLMNPYDFFTHDVAHATLIEDLYNGTVSRSWQPGKNDRALIGSFYRDLDYDKISRELNVTDRVLFDIGYFLYFHEFMGGTLWIKDLVGLPGKRSRPSPEQIYHRFEDFKVVTLDGLMKIELTEKGRRLWVARFLDKGDLWVNLPLELKAGFSDDQHYRTQINKFIEDSLTLFMRVHWNAVLTVLKKA